MKKPTRWVLAILCMMLVGILARVLIVLNRNPLPKDEVMLEHFHSHRAEFEQLLKGHRNHRDGNVPYDRSSEEVENLMRKVYVQSIAEAGFGGRWYPEPYSEHTLQVLKSLYVRPVKNLTTENEVMSTLKRELPALFAGVPPLEDVLDVARVTTVAKFYRGPDPDRLQWGARTFRYLGSFLTKGWCHFPQPPRVENGHIINADYSLVDKAYTRPGVRAFDSLDFFPPHWERGECVLRQIDSQWFLFMCRVSP